jgi:hypothetical protein
MMGESIARNMQNGLEINNRLTYKVAYCWLYLYHDARTHEPHFNS